VLNAFTIDLEDWYQGIEFPIGRWSSCSKRVEKGLYRIFSLLEEYSVKATFFSLGWIAEKYPAMIKEIAASGHELGSHGYSHEKVYSLTKDEFREEIKVTKNRLEDLIGKPVTTHRSPFFSITSKSLWALDILKKEGIEIDCSISPVKTWRYGIKSCPDCIFRIREADIVEFPVSSFRFFGMTWGIGGANFRLLPCKITKDALDRRMKLGKQNMFYIHPWEYDENHPKVRMNWKAGITHYARLSKTLPNTVSLLKNYKFGTVSDVVLNYQNKFGGLSQISIDHLQE